ncbi:MAG: hypothetical protein ACREA2_15170 [Blastocatellia bacterium]
MKTPHTGKFRAGNLKMKKRMIADKENPAPVSEDTPEEEALLERSSAPTLRDLREAAKDRFMTTEAEPEPAPPGTRLPSQEA